MSVWRRLHAWLAPIPFTSGAGLFLSSQPVPPECIYAIPIYVGDLSIPAVAYIKNFLLTPHADFTGLPGKYNLWSAGADFSASLARLFVLPFDASIGVSASYLGGTLYEHTGQDKPWAVSLIFGVDF